MTAANALAAAAKTVEGPAFRESARRVGMFFAVVVGSSAFCAWALLWVWAAYSAIWGGMKEGFVDLPSDGGAMELVGAPGDEIRLQLFESDSSPDNGKSSSYLQVGDAESRFQTTLPLRFESGEEDDSGFRPIFVRISMPGVPGSKTANLTGTIWGEVVFKSDESRSVEVPVHLRIVQPGEAETSGYRDTSGADRASLVFVLVGCIATAAMTALLYADWVIEDARTLSGRDGQGSRIATGKHGGMQ